MHASFIKKLITVGILLPGLTISTLGLPGIFAAQSLIAHAESVGPITFETSTYAIGSINGQDGWTVTGSYDQGVVAAPVAYPTFQAQSFRISNAVTSGSFGDQTFAKPVVNAAGESSSTAGAFSVGTLQSHFETQFDLASIAAIEQPGMAVSVSPDRGDGSRMSYLRFVDATSGIDVFFDDVQGTSSPANFVETQIATGLSRTVPHTIKLAADFIDGPSNDVVTVSIDNVVVHTGTSWENYYRYDAEAAAEQSPRIVKTVLFRVSGTAFPENAGNGFLFDNLSLSSSQPVVVPPVTTTTTVTIAKYLDGALATASSASNAAFPMHAIFPGGEGDYALSNVGFNNPTAYEATTGEMPIGSNYSTYEITGGDVVGADCSAAQPYSLIGYSSGNTLAEAASSTPTSTVPSFTNLTSNKYVIVWNQTCSETPTPTSTLKVHILKYLDGAEANASSANGYQFPMTATWTAANLNGGATTTSAYVLGNSFGSSTKLYGADTLSMQSPANYATQEVTNDMATSSIVLPAGAACVPGDYRLTGYQTSATSFADAANQSSTTSTPSFSGLTSDRYVIVSNITCTPSSTSLGEISGIKFEDWDADGSPYEAQWEVKLAGWTIYLDTNNNGVLDPTETSTITNASGSYRFANLPAGTYTVREVSQPGWTQVTPTSTAYAVNLAAGQIVGGKDFGNTQMNTNPNGLGEISGIKFEDWDADSSPYESQWEVKLAGWTIFLDTNANGVLDPTETSTVTNASGSYRFANLPAGTYTVGEVQKSGWMQITPHSSEYTVNLTAGQIVGDKDFGNFKLGTISGLKFNDKNGNGKQGGNEPGLSGWIITLTKLNSSSSFSTTTVTDASGKYSFSNLAQGTYKIREVPQAGWYQTTKNPSNVKVYSYTDAKANFGNHFGKIKRGGEGYNSPWNLNSNDWNDQ